MVRLHDFIDVDVPCDVAYRQWAAFDEYPLFMSGVRAVLREKDAKLHWQAKYDGREEEWDADIVEEVGSRRLEWQGAERVGIITFQPKPWGGARVFVDMDQAPLEACSDARHYSEAAAYRVHGDLEKFKERIERTFEGSPLLSSS